jgi:superfamily I DNA/RNA helicase
MAKKKITKTQSQQSVVKLPTKLIWSEYQKNIFKNVAKETGHTIVEAYAGSSKTTSIIESLKYVPKGKSVLVLAFNKIIQQELKERAPSYIQDVLTFHSLGFRAIKKHFGSVELDENKVFVIIKDLLDNSKDYDLINNIKNTVSFCKYSLQDSPSQIDYIIDDYGVDTCDMERDEFISIVVKVLSIDKKQTSKIDFDDMCWFPFIYDMSLGQYDYVFTDESQDLNRSQLTMAKKACKQDGGRLIMVGDPYQAIYGWRMADTSIIKQVKEQSTTKILPLPISYRCPKKMIELAKNWVPDITCPDTAVEGEIEEITYNKLYTIAKPGCFVLSRLNAPLIKVCLNFIKRGIKSNIRGRDIGKQIGHLIKKSKKKTIPEFLKWLEKWKDNEVAKLVAKHSNTDNILDRFECLVNLCDECKTLKEVSDKIQTLFEDTDSNNFVICSTVHRAKGLETDDVFVLRSTFRTWFDKMEDLYKPNEEANIAYVAITRAIKRLFIVVKGQ